MERYELGRQIGQGSFGRVCVAVDKVSRQSVVVKAISASRLTPRERMDVEREVQLLAHLQHPNVVEYVESFYSVERSSFYIVMEYCEGGDLYSLISRHGSGRSGGLLPESLILFYFVQLCRALAHIHERKILHRDVKSRNVFLCSRLRRIKLGDFGIARILHGGSGSQPNYARTCVGTPYYLSPEVWENKPYDSKSDLWAAGCVLYEMTTLKHPFKAGCLKSLMFKIIRGSYPTISPQYSYDLRNLIAALLKKNPSERPTLVSILRRGFIKRAESDFGDGGGEKVCGARKDSNSRSSHHKAVYLRKPVSARARRKVTPSPTVEINFEIFARDGTREKICPVDPLIKPASSAASPRSSSSSNVSNLCRPLNAENRDKEKVRHPSENAHPDEDFPESLVQTRNEHMVEREQSLVERNTKSSNLAWESHSQRMKKKIIKDDEDKAMQILNAYRGGMAMWIDLSSPVQQSSVANSDTFVVSSGTNEDTFVIEGRTKAPEKRNTSDSLKENNHELIKVTNSSVTWTNVFRKIFCTSESNTSIIERDVPDPKFTNFYVPSPVVQEKDAIESANSSTSVSGNARLNSPTVDDKSLLLSERPESPVSSHETPVTRSPLSWSPSLPNLHEVGLPEKEKKGRSFKSDTTTLNDEDKTQEEETVNGEDHMNDIHCYLEEQRVKLEAQVGLPKLLQVYRLISDIEEQGREQVDYSALASILGPSNECYIDEIIQLVVADSFY